MYLSVHFNNIQRGILAFSIKAVLPSLTCVSLLVISVRGLFFRDIILSDNCRFSHLVNCLTQIYEVRWTPVAHVLHIMHCSLNYVHAGAPKKSSHILVKKIANKEIKRLLVGHGNYSSTAICREKITHDI